MAGMILFPAIVRAQDARVVTGDFLSGRIEDITFHPPGIAQLNNDDSFLSGLVSLVFRDDGSHGLHLIAADRLRGRVLFYTDAVGTGAVVLDRGTPSNPPFPDGLSLDASRNLYGTSSGVAPDGTIDARVWVLRRDPDCTSGCLPCGYDPTLGTLDAAVEITVPISGHSTVLPVDLLGDTRVE